MSAHADLSFDGQNRFVMKGKRLPITLVNASGGAELTQ